MNSNEIRYKVFYYMKQLIGSESGNLASVCKVPNNYSNFPM